MILAPMLPGVSRLEQPWELSSGYFSGIGSALAALVRRSGGSREPLSRGLEADGMFPCVVIRAGEFVWFHFTKKQRQIHSGLRIIGSLKVA